MKKVTPIFRLLKTAFAHLSANDPIRMAGATAFFSFFALPPIVIILSTLLGSLFNNRSQRVRGLLFDELADLFGPKSANQLEAISERIQLPKPNYSLTILSIILVLVASTTLFAIVKNSLNQLWNVKSRSGHTFIHFITDKLIALAIIVSSGVLFSISVTLEQVLAKVSADWSLSALHYYGPVASVGHLFMSILIRMIWFALLFKILPDVRIAWRAVWLGALFTSILFKIGENILSRLLINSQLGSLYGSSGALILVLLFIFYASLIFYYGAAFMRQYTDWTHLTAQPNSRAVAYTLEEIDPQDAKENS